MGARCCNHAVQCPKHADTSCSSTMSICCTQSLAHSARPCTNALYKRCRGFQVRGVQCSACKMVASHEQRQASARISELPPPPSFELFRTLDVFLGDVLGSRRRCGAVAGYLRRLSLHACSLGSTLETSGSSGTLLVRSTCVLTVSMTSSFLFSVLHGQRHAPPWTVSSAVATIYTYARKVPQVAAFSCLRTDTTSGLLARLHVIPPLIQCGTRLYKALVQGRALWAILCVHARLAPASNLAAPWGSCSTSSSPGKLISNNQTCLTSAP